MVNAKNPIPESQMIANVKIAIGGGINEPRDALLTVLYGLLTNPDQLETVRAEGKWRAAFGTSPTQAEKSRPDRKVLASATLATSAVASAGPTPGIASSRLLVAFDRCQAIMPLSNSRI